MFLKVYLKLKQIPKDGSHSYCDGEMKKMFVYIVPFLPPDDYKWKSWIKGCILFLFFCTIWSKLKFPRSNIPVTFAVDKTFSICSIKSVMKLWIVSVAQWSNTSKVWCPILMLMSTLLLSHLFLLTLLEIAF